MAYSGEGSGEKGPGKSWKGTSKQKIDNAIRAAVHASGVPDNTTFVVTEIKVTSKGDPNVGAYSVIIEET